MSADGILSGAGDCIQACAGTDAIKGCAGACTCAASGIPCYTITINAGTQIYGGYYFRWAAQTIVVTNQGGYCHWSGCWNLEYSPDNSTWTAATGACWLGFDTGCYFAIFMQTVIGGVTYWVGAGKRTLSPGYNQMPDGGYSPWDGAWTDMGWVVSATTTNCAYVDGMETRYKGTTASGPWTLDYYRGFRGCTSLGCTRSTSSGGIYWESVNGSAWIDIGGPFLATDAYGRLYTSIPGGVAYAPVSYCYVAHDTFSGYVMTVGEITALSWVACDWGCPRADMDASGRPAVRGRYLAADAACPLHCYRHPARPTPFETLPNHLESPVE